MTAPKICNQLETITLRIKWLQIRSDDGNGLHFAPGFPLNDHDSLADMQHCAIRRQFASGECNKHQLY